MPLNLAPQPPCNLSTFWYSYHASVHFLKFLWQFHRWLTNFSYHPAQIKICPPNCPISNFVPVKHHSIDNSLATYGTGSQLRSTGLVSQSALLSQLPKWTKGTSNYPTQHSHIPYLKCCQIMPFILQWSAHSARQQTFWCNKITGWAQNKMLNEVNTEDVKQVLYLTYKSHLPDTTVCKFSCWNYQQQ
jgi:hypothetical protein